MERLVELLLELSLENKDILNEYLLISNLMVCLIFHNLDNNTKFSLAKVVKRSCLTALTMFLGKLFQRREVKHRENLLVLFLAKIKALSFC